MPFSAERKALFRNFTIASFICVFLLVQIGGFVRISGSGLGCPDWPTCFGRWIPPTDESQLPADYKTKYHENECSGTEFNALKTWIEYINRLFGVTTGLAVFGMAASSFTLWKEDKTYSYLSVLALVLTGFEGWLGAIVVKTCLAHSMISVHFFTALVILALIIFLFTDIMMRDREVRFNPLARESVIYATALLAIFLVQFLIGTMTRMEIDELVRSNDTLLRTDWISRATDYLPIHRSFSILLAVACIYPFIRLWKWAKGTDGNARFSVLALIISTVGQILTGSVLNNLGFPASAQVLHIFFGSVIFSALIYIISYNISGFFQNTKTGQETV